MALHGVSPQLFLQKPGQVLVLPENWMHAVINLEESIGAAWVFPRSYGGRVCTRQNKNDGEMEKETL